MKKILANVLLAGLLFSMAAAKTDAKKGTRKGADAPAAAAAKAQNFNGWISDEKCGARIDPDCAKKCQEQGVKMVFVNADKQIFPLSNQDAVKAFAGQHVNLTGKLENGILTVGSVTKAGK